MFLIPLWNIGDQIKEIKIPEIMISSMNTITNLQYNYQDYVNLVLYVQYSLFSNRTIILFLSSTSQFRPFPSNYNLRYSL